MLYINDKMKKVIAAQNNEELDEETKKILKDIVNQTKQMKDCIIFDDEGLNESDIHFDRVLKFVGDLTGYEVACNEFRKGKSEFWTAQFQKTASYINKMLKNKFGDREFAVYICINDEDIEIRFHTYRENEGLWLTEDFNEYNNPILCLVQ